MFQHHQDAFRPALLLLVALLFLQATGSASSTNDGTCYSRQHRDTAVDVSQALDNHRTIMEARLKLAEKDCILDCCAEELKPGMKCNMVVYKQKSQAENCYLFYCETEQDCPLMPSKPGINTYDIFKGQTHPPAKGAMRTTTVPVMKSSQQPSTTQSTTTTTTTTPTTTTQPPTTTTSTTPSTTTTATTTLPTTTPTTITTSTTTTTTATTAAPTELAFILLTLPVVTIPPTTATTTTTTTTTTTQTTTTTTKTPSVTSVSTTTTTRPPQPPRPHSNPIRPSKKPSKPPKKPEPHWKPTTQKQTTRKATTPTTTPTTTTTTPTTTTTTTTSPTTTTMTSTTTSTTTSTERTTIVVVKMENDLGDGDTEPNSLMQPALPPTKDKAKTSHIFWKNSLVALVVLTLIVLTLFLAIVGRKAMESFDRRHYTRLELNDLHYEI